MKKVFKAVQELADESYQKHFDTFDPENIGDFTDAYIKQQLDCKDDPNSSFHGNRGKLNYISVLVSLFQAGSDITANTMSFVLWYLCKYPMVQTKVQEEIDAVVGKNRMPSLNDKPNLSYLEAVVNEVQRIFCVPFMGLFRVAKTDVTIGGHRNGESNGVKYFIPKDTLVTGALHEMMRDPDYFDKPTEFLPERFLDEKGKYRPDEKLVPFGIGKRSCPGKTLADTELFLFLAAFLQRFQFSFPKGSIIPETITPEVGFILSCPTYDIVIGER